MFALRRLCVYEPGLLAPHFPSPNSFLSPTCTKTARNSFASPTYAKTGGWGPRFRRNSFHLKSYFTVQRRFSLVSISGSPLPTRQVHRNVGAPTFCTPATRRRATHKHAPSYTQLSTGNAPPPPANLTVAPALSLGQTRTSRRTPALPRSTSCGQCLAGANQPAKG
jgi:hypothetical protein